MISRLDSHPQPPIKTEIDVLDVLDVLDGLDVLTKSLKINVLKHWPGPGSGPGRKAAPRRIAAW